MAGWMHQQRMAGWLGKMLVALSLATSCGVQAEGTVYPSTSPATVRGAFEFSYTYDRPSNPPWFPTLQSECEANAAYVSGLRDVYAGAYCSETHLEPENVAGYWIQTIVLPNWPNVVNRETAAVPTRATCPSGYGNGTYIWDETTTPRTMVVICSRSGNSCPDNSTPDQPTNPTICTCNTGYAPDAAKTSCVPVATCPIDPLPGLPKDDACAQSLNDGKGVDIRHQCPDITDDMKKGVECLAKKIAAFYPPITYSGPSATIRNKAYQKHLSDVYDKSEEIAGTDWTDAEKQACAAVFSDVDKEMKWHKIKAGPSKKGDQAPHVKGEAIDIPEDVSKALIERCTKTSIKALVTTYFPGCIKCQHIPLVTGNVEDYINSAVINPPACNLEWGGLFKNNYDPIHFQLPQKK